MGSFVDKLRGLMHRKPSSPEDAAEAQRLRAEMDNVRRATQKVGSVYCLGNAVTGVRRTVTADVLSPGRATVEGTLKAGHGTGAD